MSEDILAEARKELMEKGFIDQDLLAWAMIKESSFKFSNVFFGIKNGELMILPIVNFKEMLLNEVKYYKKGDVENFTFSGFAGVIKIKLKQEGSFRYRPMGTGNSIPDLKKIVSMFNQ